VYVLHIRELIFNKRSMVNSSDVDAAVGVLALINALLLLIPVTLIGNLQLGTNWGALYTAAHFTGPAIVDGVSTPWVMTCSADEFSLKKINDNMSNYCLSIIYISLACLILTLLYYITRPKNADDVDQDKDRDFSFALNPAHPELGFREVVEQAADLDLFSTAQREEFAEVYTASDRMSTKKLIEKKFGSYWRTFWGTLAANEKRVEDAVLRRQNWKDPLRLKFAQLCQFRYRSWWRRAKWVFFGMAVGTMFSIGLTLAMIGK
jgi:hypothetical protein